MRLSDLIEELSALEEMIGDVDVTITDSITGKISEGMFDVVKYVDHDGYVSVDIGIGGL